MLGVDRLQGRDVGVHLTEGHDRAVAPLPGGDLRVALDAGERRHVGGLAGRRQALLLDLDHLGLERHHVASQPPDDLARHRFGAEQDGLSDTEVVDGRGQRTVEQQRQHGDRTGRDQRQAAFELQLQQLAVQHQLHELVDRRNRAGQAAEVGADAQHVDVREGEDLFVHPRQVARQHALAEVTELDHDHDAVGSALSPGLRVERLEDLELGVQGHVGERHHLVEGRLVGRPQVPRLGPVHRAVDRPQVLEPTVGDGSNADRLERLERRSVATQRLGDDRQLGAVGRRPAAHGIEVVTQRLEIDGDAVHAEYLISAYFEEKPIRSYRRLAGLSYSTCSLTSPSACSIAVSTMRRPRP